jgi:hypothetical protein
VSKIFCSELRSWFIPRVVIFHFSYNGDSLCFVWFFMNKIDNKRSRSWSIHPIIYHLIVDTMMSAKLNWQKIMKPGLCICIACNAWPRTSIVCWRACHNCRWQKDRWRSVSRIWKERNSAAFSTNSCKNFN